MHAFWSGFNATLGAATAMVLFAAVVVVCALVVGGVFILKEDAEETKAGVDRERFEINGDKYHE